MKSISLKNRVYLLTTCCGVLFIAVILHILLSWSTIKLAIERDDYANHINHLTNRLEQTLISESFSYYSDDQNHWLNQQSLLTKHLLHPPKLTDRQQSILNSIRSQNISVKRLYQLLKKEDLHPTKAIKEHLISRLITQSEAIRSDSERLSSIAQQEIRGTIQKEIFIIILLLTISMGILLFVTFKIGKIFTVSIHELKSAIEDNQEGFYEEINLTHHSSEFDGIVNQFNSMNKMLSETTISLDLLQIIVDERTESLTKQSNTDSLTNIANRRALYERGSIEFSRENRHNTDLSIIMLDCDFFKAINDKYGHVVGDKLLVHLCDICKKEIRDLDLLARFGGEEFVILLPDCNITGANEIAMRIQHSLKENSLMVDGNYIPVTVSMGITSASTKHKTFEELVNSADKAMYFAKENGRNRIEIVDS